MAAAFAEAHRVLKPGAPLVCVYAHKTTLGWATLVEALRRAGFTITEAWPLDTEMPERSLGQGTASLASSIFLVARKRDGVAIGDSDEVQRQLDAAIAERLDRLIAAGVSGSDLVIATIGAGLAPFTRYASVELPNGEALPADRFLETRAGQGAGRNPGQGPRPRRRRRWPGRRDALLRDGALLLRLRRRGLRRGQQPRAQRGPRTWQWTQPRPHSAGQDHQEGGAPAGLRGARRGRRARARRRPAHRRPARPPVAGQPPALRGAPVPRPDAAGSAAAAARRRRRCRGPRCAARANPSPPEAQACERLLGSWRTLVEENLFTR